MRFSFLTLVLIGLIALTACGGEPDVVAMDRRYLTSEQLDQQAAKLKDKTDGEVLDTYEWADGENRLVTLLSRERDTEGYEGIFLHHYQLGKQGPLLLWTYQDSITCLGANAGEKVLRRTQYWSLTPLPNSAPKLLPVMTVRNSSYATTSNVFPGKRMNRPVPWSLSTLPPAPPASASTGRPTNLLRLWPNGLNASGPSGKVRNANKI